MVDASNISDLCKILNITINDLFSGEVVDMNNNEKILEENLLEMTRFKEQRDKELLLLEIFIEIIVSIHMLTCILIASLVSMENWLRIVLIIIGIIPFAMEVCYALRIEQIAGYYECDHCHYKYVPLYKNIINRTRKMNALNVIRRFGIKNY